MTDACLNTIRVKNCSTCGTSFNCGDTLQGSKCWCNDFPPIFNPSDIIDCLCPSCFKKACLVKIDEYVATISPETALTNKAGALPKTTNLVEDIDYYIEEGNYVFKAWYHLKRGYCCKNACRHCPY